MCHKTKGVTKLNVFLDTMVYLHYIPIKQIDFCSTFNTSIVTLLVPRVTFKELEKHKAAHTLSRTRERSRQVLSFLESQIESGSSVRAGVLIKFIPQMPQVDMETYGLNPAWNDDLLIASVLDYKEHNPSVETVVVTDDTGARLTCHNLGIRTVGLPEKYRLPPELDEREKENQRLQRELQKIQNALPKITVGFADGLSSKWHLSLEQPDEVDEPRITDTLSQLKKEFPELPTGSSILQQSLKLSGSNLLPDMIPEDEFDRYNKDRIAYFTNYEHYMRAMVVSGNLVKRSIRFTIAISNSGSAPADDVDVRLNFPNGFVLYTKNDIPSFPDEPKLPTKPQNSLQMLQSRLASFNLNPPRVLVPEFSPQSSFQLRKTNSYEIKDHFTRIKHGFTKELPELFLTFDSYADARSFNCDYEISTGNLPEPVQGKLHFVVEKDSAVQTSEDT